MIKTPSKTPSLEELTNELAQLKVAYEMHKNELATDFLYKQIVDNMSDVVFISDLSFHLTYLSPSAQSLLGWTMDELKEAFLERVFSPNSIAILSATMEKELTEDSLAKSQSEPYISCEVQLYKADGSLIWGVIRSSFVRNKEGHPESVIGVLHDITQTKTVQFQLEHVKSLREQESMLARVGSWEVDFENDVVFWSDMTKMIHEVPLDYIPSLSTGIDFYKDGESRDAITRLVNKAIQDGESYMAELQIVTHKGNELWVRTTAKVEMLEGKCVKIRGAIQDIDAHKLTQIALEETHRLYDDMASYTRTVMWKIDVTGLILYISPLCKDIYGYTPDELIQKEYFYNLHPLQGKDEFIEQALELLAKKESVVDFKNMVLSKQGKLLYVSTNAIPLYDKEGNVIAYQGSDTDITEQTLLQNELDSQNAFQALVATISNQFITINGDNFEERFQAVLQFIGNSLHVDRAYLVEPDDIDGYMSKTFEWCSECAIRIRDDFQQVLLATLPLLDSVVKKREVFFIPDVDAMPEVDSVDKTFLQKRSVKTLLAVPIIKEQQLVGYLGIETVEMLYPISQNQIELFQVIANMVGDLLLKIQFDKEREQHLHDVLARERQKEALLESMDDLVFVLDKNFVFQDFAQPSPGEQLYISTNDFIGKSFVEIDFPEPAHSIILQALGVCLSTSQPQKVEYYLDFKQEREWFDARITPYKNEEQETIGLVCVVRDMTESIVQKKSLQESNALLQKLSAETPGVVYQYQLFPDGRSSFPYASPHIFDVYEVYPEDVKNDASIVLSRLHPEDAESVVLKIQASHDTLSVWEEEFRVLLPTLGLKWLKGIARPEKQPDGSVLWHGYIFDNTEAKQTEIKLQNTQHRLELVINGTNDGIFDWDIVSNHHYLSKRWKEMLGYKESELQDEPHTFEKLLYSEDKETVLQYLRDYLDDKFNHYAHTFRMLHKDGSVRWISSSGKVVRDESGRAIRMAGSHSDITQRVEQEQLLKESEERYRLLSDNSPLGLFQFRLDSSGDTSLTYASEKLFHILYMHDVKEYENFSLLSIMQQRIHPTHLNQFFSTLEDSQITRSEFSGEFLFLVEGQYMWREIHANPTFLGDGYTLWNGVIIDNHAQKEALERNKEQALFIQSLMNTMPDLIFYKNILGVYEMCNERFASYNNTTIDAIIGKKDEDIASLGYVAMFQASDKELFVSKKSVSSTHWDTFPDGTRALHYTVKTPHLNTEGELVGILGVSRDIADIHNVQAELIQTKQQLESVFNEMEEVVWSMSMPDMKVHFISPAAENLFETMMLSHQGDTNTWWRSYVHPEDAYIVDAIMNTLQEVGVYDSAYRIITEKGTIKHIRCRGKFIFNEAGLPIRLDGVMTDRTKEALAYYRILDEIALQQILLQTAADFIHLDLLETDNVINRSLQNFGTFVGADRVYVFDYDVKNKVSSNTYEWCDEGITAEICNLQNVPLENIDAFYREHQQHKTFYCFDIPSLHQDDLLRKILEPQGILSVVTVPMFDEHELVGFVGFDYVRSKHAVSTMEEQLLFFFADMLTNTRKRQGWEQQLKLEEQKLRNILTNANMGLLELDNQMNVKYANRAFCEMSGAKAENLLHKNANKLFPLAIEQDGRFFIHYTSIKSNEVCVLDAEGQPRWWFINCTPNYNDKGDKVGSIAVHLDVTHQRQLSDDLERAVRIAEKSAQAKDMFLANMSHEIRTPLNIIVGMIRQLSKENLSEQQQYYVKQTDTSSRHLLAIVNNILDVAKIESSDISIEKKPFSLIAMLQNVESLMSQQAQEKQIEYVSQIAPQLHAAHVGDELRLRQILINIVGNAVKFTQKGAIRVQVDVLQDKPNSQFIRIQVEDTGIGIGKEFLKGIFTKFTQEDTASNRLHQGTGLGLSISKELVQLMGGSIEIASVKGKGSLFTIFLDLEKASISQLVVEKPYVLQNSLRDYAVLLVEDNEMNRYIAKQSLAFLGCTVTEAENGKIAIEILKQTTFDLILMDIQMPVMDGIEATRFIRNDLKLSVPIIALTANAYAQKLDNYVQQGMDDYITKPFDEEAFYQKISQFLRLKPQEGNVIAEKSTSVDLDTQEVADLYDLQQLQDISKGDVAFVQKMLELFVRLAEQHCVELQEALLEKDLTRINKLAHKIKPSIDQMGIVRLRDKIRTIEKFSLQTNTQEELDILVNEVCRVLQAVVFDLKKHI